MHETLDRSSLGALVAGTPVNLERPVTLADRLGGHLVQGHVDGTGARRSRARPASTGRWCASRCRPSLARYVVEKGSITVDGVSLTVVEVGRRLVHGVSLIPTTLELTTLGHKRSATPVNLEVDVIAKYVERCCSGRTR